MADNTNDLQPTESITAAVGLEDGTVIDGENNNREEIVYDYDDNNQLLGWHKAPIK